MEVAIRAAKEVGADVLAPELFRLASETAHQARNDYRFKDFQSAKRLANQARVYAEKAEFESIRNGGQRELIPTDPLAEPSYSPIPVQAPEVQQVTPSDVDRKKSPLDEDIPPPPNM